MVVATWDEVLRYGSGECKAILLAHAIILGIAVIRYVIRPWWARLRSATARAPQTGP